MMTRRQLLAALVAGPMAATTALRDDTPYLQYLIDHGIPVPAGTYHLRTPLDSTYRQGRAWYSSHSRYVFHADARIAFDNRTPHRVTRNVFDGTDTNWSRASVRRPMVS